MNTKNRPAWGVGPWKIVALGAAAALVCLPLFSQNKNSKSSPESEEEEIFELSPFTVDGASNVGYRVTNTLAGTRLQTGLKDIGSSIGATVGGAQDARHLRDLIAEGLIPAPASFTPEGLFSEHDLPISGLAQEGFLFDLACQAIPFTSQAQPEVDTLVQLGFVSGIDANTFRRPPLNLVAVVDKSGSMQGQPIDLVRRSLRQLVSQLGSQDQLTIITFDRNVSIHLNTTVSDVDNQASIAAAIDSLTSSGTTNLDGGLKLGYDLARRTADNFEGLTRVMVFTDEQPNVGRTDADSFMALAERGSRDGIGLTTIGVGIHFGAELAQKVSAVRGGNLFFFEDPNTMEATFRKELDTLVTELAYDMRLHIAPAPGRQIAGLYGIPGDVVSWNSDGSISLHVSTIFASRNNGAIYFGLKSENVTPRQSDSLATVSVSYTQADNKALRQSTLAARLTPKRDRMAGIVKGGYLVDQYSTFKLATILYENGEYRAAADLAAAFARRPLPLNDKALAKEQVLAQRFAALLADEGARRSPEVGNILSHRDHDTLRGEWTETRRPRVGAEREVLRFANDDIVEVYGSSDAQPLRYIGESKVTVDRQQIVLENWGQRYTYTLRGDTLILSDGDSATVYHRRDREIPGIASHSDLHRLQRLVSGLPPSMPKSELSAR